MPTIAIRIDPQGKGRPRFSTANGNVVAFTPTKTRTYEAEIAWVMKSQWRMRPLEGPIEVEIDFYIRKPKSVKGSKDREFPTVAPDCDNLMKAVFDAASGILWKDDAQLVTILCRKRYCDSGSIIMHVTKAIQGG